MQLLIPSQLSFSFNSIGSSLQLMRNFALTAERRAKSFATGRKNWLFVKTIDGADASCFFYSLIETAKENGLNPEKYLEYVLTYGPSTPKEKYDTLLPWNVDMSKVEEAIAARANAVPDPERKEPYILTGLSR